MSNSSRPRMSATPDSAESHTLEDLVALQYDDLLLAKLSRFTMLELRAVVCNIIEWSNFKYDNGMTLGRRHMLFWIIRLSDDAKCQKKSFLCALVYLAYVVEKHGITYPKNSYCHLQIVDTLLSRLISNLSPLVDDRPAEKRLRVAISNFEGIPHAAIQTIILKDNPQTAVDVYDRFFPFDDPQLYDTESQLSKQMAKIETVPDRQAVIHLSVLGRDDCWHFNALVWNQRGREWYRVEPAGMIIPSEPRYVAHYQSLDSHLHRFLQSRFRSHNDYHLLPGLHLLNPGPYCTLYGCMILNRYFATNNIYQAIESVLDISWVFQKMKEYVVMLEATDKYNVTLSED